MAKTDIVAPAIRRGSSFDPRPFFADAGHPSSSSNYRRDQIVFSQGDPADAIFYIEEGIVRVSTHSRQGKKAVTALLGAGDFFGEEGLAGRPRRIATVNAMTDCAILRLELPAMLHALHQEPKLSELFVKYLASRRIEVEEDLVDQLLNSTEKRLARRFLLLGEPDSDGGSKPVTARINQDTLAAMVGTTQARVSFFMSKFRRRGLIDYDDELRVHGSLLSAFLQE